MAYQSQTIRASAMSRPFFNVWLELAQDKLGYFEGIGFEGYYSGHSQWKSVRLNTLWSHISASTLARRMFRMSEQKFNAEWLGLAPENARIGDFVAILEGGKVPYILRKREQASRDSTERWELIGDAYVDGIMDGEATQTGETMREIWIT